LDWSSFMYGFILAIIILVSYKLLGIFVFKSDKYNVTDINNINKSSYNTNNISRHATYLPPVPNTWYHLCNSDDIKPGNKPIYIRALGQNLVVWRTIEGEPVIMNSYCPHMGANLGVGGEITRNDNIKCPFHGWEFNKNGSLVSIPYFDNGKKLPKCKSIKTYICQDWCGWLCIYFHADFEEKCLDNKPEFPLPQFISNEINDNKWHLLKHHIIGHKQLSCIDWADQSGDHCHFHTLHAKLFVPYTTIPVPEWLSNIIGIKHKLITVLGNKWNENHREYNTFKNRQTQYYGMDNIKQYIYFMDEAGITWRGKLIKKTLSITKEFYCGPAIMVFHIPIKNVGKIKIFVSTTPTVNNDGVSGGSYMRTMVWLSNNSWKLYIISWIVVGISLSQLLADINIMENKIRLSKSLITRYCGPFNKVNAWLKDNFYSKSSKDVGKHNYDDW